MSASSVYHMYDGKAPEKGIRYPGTRVINACEPSSECWESNLHPPQEQPVLLIAKLVL